MPNMCMVMCELAVSDMTGSLYDDNESVRSRRSGRSHGRYRAVAQGSTVDESLFGETVSRPYLSHVLPVCRVLVYLLTLQLVLVWNLIVSQSLFRWLSIGWIVHSYLLYLCVVLNACSLLQMSTRTKKERSKGTRGSALRSSGARTVSAPSMLTMSRYDLMKMKEMSVIKTKDDLKRDKREKEKKDEVKNRKTRDLKVRMKALEEEARKIAPKSEMELIKEARDKKILENGEFECSSVVLQFSTSLHGLAFCFTLRILVRVSSGC